MRESAHYDPTPRRAEPGEVGTFGTWDYWRVSPVVFEDHGALLCLECYGDPSVTETLPPDEDGEIERVFECQHVDCTHEHGLFEEPRCSECDSALPQGAAWLLTGFRNRAGIYPRAVHFSYLCKACFREQAPEEYLVSILLDHVQRNKLRAGTISTLLGILRDEKLEITIEEDA